MQSGVGAKNQQGNVQLVSPEMRLRIRELKRELDECDYRLSRHLDPLYEYSRGARYCATNRSVFADE